MKTITSISHRLPKSQGHKASHRPRRIFQTSEEKERLATGSLQPFFRRHDPLCENVLNRGLDPCVFEETRTIFPYFRAVSVLQIPLDWQHLPEHATNAFYAGLTFAQIYPGEAANLLSNPHDRAQADAALHAVRDFFNHCEPSPQNVYDLHSDFSDPLELEGDLTLDILVDYSIKAFHVGIGVGTIGRTNPALSDICARIYEYPRWKKLPLISRFLQNTLVRARVEPEVLLQHPLLSLAQAHYSETPVEGTHLLGFFNRQLEQFDVISETECPGDPDDLIRWIDKAVNFATRLQERCPAEVESILRETGEEKVEFLCAQAREIIATAGGLSGRQLLPVLLQWHKDVFGWNEPSHYARSLQLVLYLADYAAWLPWLTNKSNY